MRCCTLVPHDAQRITPPGAYNLLTRGVPCAAAEQQPEASMRLTKKKIDRVVPPATGQVIYWDDDLAGFGLRVTPTRMTYISQGRVDGRTVRVTLGRHGPLTPGMARNEARKRLGDMARGIDHNPPSSVRKTRWSDPIAGVPRLHRFKGSRRQHGARL